MTPDQLDRLQLAILNMVLLDDGDDPITLAQLQAENAADPAAAAEQRAKVQKLAAAVLQVMAPGPFYSRDELQQAENLPPRKVQPELRLLYETAAKGFHVQHTCGADDTYQHVSKFQSMQDLGDFHDAWLVAMTAARDGR